MTELEVVRARTRSQVLAVLTPEQLEQVKQAMVREMDDRRPPMGGPGEW